MKKLIIVVSICLSSVFVKAQTDSLIVVRTPVENIKSMTDQKQAGLVEGIEKDLEYIRSFVKKGSAVPQWPEQLANRIGVLQRTGYDVKAYIKEYQYYQNKLETNK